MDVDLNQNEMWHPDPDQSISDPPLTCFVSVMGLRILFTVYFMHLKKAKFKTCIPQN